MITKTKLLVFKPSDNGYATIYIPFEVDEIIVEHGSLIDTNIVGPVIVQSSLFNPLGIGSSSALITTVDLAIGLMHVSNKTHFIFKNPTPITGSYKFLFFEPFTMVETALEEVRLLITFRRNRNKFF